ncbi:haloacid dehalogenase-like hydrolase [Nannocystis exedens]|uniref:Haloacid dehalogenase-like hydrolase n=1 Tax=Nannocystis exedens TaxID=54 RepID=A0A1I1Z9P5_9BACT|nr:HAD-IA family hydrolase [Nannocystis exedens]PCC75102.1 Alpha-D-glucose-1-phosphate phosphatase YihX [Nannocystis exedens]SFE28028.1 haloacid dehalogenase-like hydrolase [Nannocystis exedens]
MSDSTPPPDLPLVAFDLIGVLAEPSWREIDGAPDRERWHRLRAGAIEEADFWDPAAAAAYRACLRLRTDRLALVSRLRARGHRIALATNFARAWLAVVREQLGGSGLVDHWLCSGELGVAKPDPRFWSHLRGLAPAVVVVDDQLDNVVAARAAGLIGVWALPGADLEARLFAALAGARGPLP